MKGLLFVLSMLVVEYSHTCFEVKMGLIHRIFKH